MSLDAPPQLSCDLYDPKRFIYWKKVFEVYVKSKSLRLWRVIEFGDYVPYKVSPYGNGMIVKPESEWTEEDEAKVSENYLAIRLLHSVLSNEDFEIIFFCDTAHDIWITLGIIHEAGNYQLKDSKINRFTQQFETFKVYGRDIYSKYVSFKRIINCLKALGKTYTNEVCVERFLSALPSKWNDKVKTILENENLSVLSLDELIGDLQDYENTFKKRYEYLREDEDYES